MANKVEAILEEIKGLMTLPRGGPTWSRRWKKPSGVSAAAAAPRP